MVLRHPANLHDHHLRQQNLPPASLPPHLAGSGLSDFPHLVLEYDRPDPSKHRGDRVGHGLPVHSDPPSMEPGQTKPSCALYRSAYLGDCHRGDQYLIRCCSDIAATTKAIEIGHIMEAEAWVRENFYLLAPYPMADVIFQD